MAGYAVIADEIITQIDRDMRPAPTHFFAQAGVGGFAAAMAEGLRPVMADPQKVIVVEPEKAACVAAGLAHRNPVQIDGLLDTCADMLSCGIACAPALNILLRHHALAVQVGEAALLDACDVMQRAGEPATSGAAGLAGMIAGGANKKSRCNVVRRAPASALSHACSCAAQNRRRRGFESRARRAVTLGAPLR